MFRVASRWKYDRPMSRAAFEARFPDEASCARHLAARRWPDGFVCPACGHDRGWELKRRRASWECAACGKETSVTAGTIMHRSHLPLKTWFMAVHIVTSHSNGISALQLQAQLGLGSYKSAADRRAVPEIPVLNGARRMALHLRREGVRIGRRRAARLMSLMGLQAIYRAPRTSDPHPEHRVYPYLLRGLAIERANHVWCADITYIPVQRGFLYLVAIMDWASRYVLAWRLSNTLDASFCTDALDEALARHGKPEIVNTDQGSQFTSFAFTGRLQAAGIRISMDGRGRCMDNIFIERLWRSLKYEAIYLHEIADGFTARRLIGEWLRFYNVERPHSALDGRTPAEAYRGDPPVDMMDKPLRALPTSPQAQQQQKEDRSKGILAA